MGPSNISFHLGWSSTSMIMGEILEKVSDKHVSSVEVSHQAPGNALNIAFALLCKWTTDERFVAFVEWRVRKESEEIWRDFPSATHSIHVWKKIPTVDGSSLEKKMPGDDPAVTFASPLRSRFTFEGVTWTHPYFKGLSTRRIARDFWYLPISKPGSSRD